MPHGRFLTIFCLLYLILFVFAGLRPFPRAQAAGPQTGIANTPGMLQFQVEGHVLGFLPDHVYLAGLDHPLRVEFVDTPGVMPQAEEVVTFSRVTYPNLWPGIDLAYTAAAGGIAKSTYTLAPGADPALIQLRYNTPVTRQADGSLHFIFACGYLEEAAPVAWQELGGQRVEVEVSFRLAARPLATGEAPLVGFQVGRYDPHYPLVIDPVYTWHTFYGSSNSDYGYALAVDSSGGVYLAGYSNAGWTGPAGQAPLHAYAGNYDLVVVKLDSNGVYQWHTFYGTINYDYGLALAVDDSGGVYVAGHSHATWTGPAGQAPLHADSGDYDLTVVKLDSSGAYQWHTFYGSSNTDYGYALAVDGSGGVYVVGDSKASWIGPAGQAPLHAYSGLDLVVVKLDSSGAYQWHTFYGSSGNSDSGRAIVVDGSGGVYVVGDSYATWTGPAGQAPLHTYSGGLDLVVVKLDSSGAYQWHTFYGSSSSDSGRAIVLDGSGGVYVAGDSYATWTGPAGQAPLHTYSGGLDLVVVKLDSSGAYQWHTFYGSSSNDYGYALAVDGSGGVYLAGYSNASWAEPAGQPPLHAYSGGSDLVGVKLDSSGTYQWHTFYGSTSNDYGLALAVDGSGDVYMGGYSYANWTGPAGQPPLHAYSGTDLVVVKMTPSLDISVQGNGVIIADGHTTPSSADHTDFGNLVVGQMVTRTFTISNSGELDLSISSIGLSGMDAGDFSITGIVTPTTVGSNLITTFQVRFDPSVAGTRAATVIIANSDLDENPYDFAIQGTACANVVSVQNPNDSGVGSLRRAITDVCDGGTITFAADTTIYLDSTLMINKRLTIDGSNRAITVSGDSGDDNDHDVQVFYISESGVATLTHLSIISGTAEYGGGIFNTGTLTLLNSTLADNSAFTNGGGLYNGGILTVLNSTLSNNLASTNGGGISNGSGGTLTLLNSTLSSNSASGYGGGILNGGTLTLLNSTLSGNSANNGGGLYNYGTLNLTNTLIANSSSGGDCRNGAAIGANGYNLIESTSSEACNLTNGVGGNIIGVDPLLAPPGDYGGETPTFALLPGSPAIDAVNNAACQVADQRGVARPQLTGGVCDIGAFESRGFNLAYSNGSPQSTLINTAFTTPLALSVSSNVGEPVNGGQVVFTGLGSGAGLSSSPLTATISNGVASQGVTANGMTGSYNVTATTRGSLGNAVTFSLTNTLPLPEMVVLGNDVEIAEGDTNPSPDDHTDFGSVTLGGVFTCTFTISNRGTTDLTVSSIGLSGTAAGDFSVTGIVTPTTVLPANTIIFQVRFNPSVASTRVTTVTIANNDLDETPYDFAIQGMGSNIAPIANTGSDQNVAAGKLVTLNGSGSSEPDGHTPLTYGWIQTGGMAVTLSSVSVANPTFTAPSSTAVLTFSLTVTDSLGLTDPTPDEVVVTIGAVNVYLPLISKN